MGSPTHCCNLLANRTAVAWLQDAEETGGRGIIAYMNWEAGGRCQAISVFAIRLAPRSTEPPPSVLPVENGLVDIGPELFHNVEHPV
jgi:hypothetical protein